jgi:hypothetical protein
LIGALALVLIAAGVTFWLFHDDRSSGRSQRSRATQVPEGRQPRLLDTQEPGDGPGALEGRVVDEGRRPVAGAEVVLSRPLRWEDVERTAPLPLRKTVTDGAGYFRMQSLGPGAYGLGATAPGKTGAYLDPVTLASGETVRGLELALTSGGVLVSGRVLESEGVPVPGATVRAAEPSAGGRSARVQFATANSDGVYSLVLPRRPQALAATASGYATSRRAFDGQRDTSLDFFLRPGGRITVRILERATGRPVSGSELMFKRSDLPYAVVHRSEAGPDGRLELTGLEPGTYELWARGGVMVGRSPRLVSAIGGDAGQEIVISLDPGAEIAGVVRDSEGHPLEGARLEAVDIDAVPRLDGVATSGADGEFRLLGVLPGAFVLRVRKSGFLPGQIEVAVGSENDRRRVAITLARASSVSGVVSGPAGPAADVVVRATLVAARTGPAPVSGPALGTSGDEAISRTGADGTFQLLGVPPGTVQIVARGSSSGFASLGPFALQPGEHKKVALSLASCGVASGVVRSDAGAPVSGASVSAVDVEAPTHAVTAPSGEYRLEVCTGRTITIVASRSSLHDALFASPNAARRTVTLRPGEQKTGVDLVLPDGGQSISGTVLGPEGQPLGGIMVGAVAERQPVGGGGMIVFGSEQQAVATGADGTFTIADLGARPYRVWARSPAHAEAELRGVKPPATGLRLHLPAGGLVAGVVVDAEDRPQPHYTVQVLPSGAGSNGRALRETARFWGRNRHEVHDPNGTFEIGGLAAGSYDLEVTTVRGGAAHLAGVVVEDGGQRRSLRLVVSAGASVSGRVVDHHSSLPIAHARVGVGETDDRGEFMLEGVAADRPFQLTISASGYLADVWTVEVPSEGGARKLGTLRLVPELVPSGSGGVGVRLGLRGENVIVEDVMPGSPALAAGVMAGEQIMAIDGRESSGLGLRSVHHLLGGDPGTRVRVAVRDAVGKVKSITIERAAKDALTMGMGLPDQPPLTPQ